MSERPKFQNYFSTSLLLHAIILAVLVISFDFNATLPVLENSDKDMRVLNAVVLDAPPGAELPPKAQPVPKKIVQTLPQPKPMAAQPKPETIIVSEQPKKQKELKAKQLLADLHKEVEEKKKFKRKEVERALAKELKAQAAKTIEQQLLREQNHLASLQSQKARGEVNKYKALISQAISQHWVVPANINKKLTCELMIRMAPGGMVLDVQVVRGSGDIGLDNSARVAVFKASPLPVPTDSAAFEAFRQFMLRVKPETIISL